MIRPPLYLFISVILAVLTLAAPGAPAPAEPALGLSVPSIGPGQALGANGRAADSQAQEGLEEGAKGRSGFATPVAVPRNGRMRLR